MDGKVMKILFDTTNYLSTAALWKSQFEKAVGKYADCSYTGPYWPDHVKGKSLSESIKRIYGTDSPDWVFGRLDSLPDKNLRNYGVGVFLTDIHRDPRKTVEDLNSVGVDVVFMRAPLYLGKLYAKYDIHDPNYFEHNVKGKVVFLPFSVDLDYYDLAEDKEWDICFIGADRSMYPIRHRIKGELSGFCDKNNFKLVKGGRPHGFKKQGYLTKYYNNPPPGVYVGRRYTEVLTKSKTFLFDSSVMKYPVKKYFEGMAAGTLCFADEPMMAESLHFVSGYNYINITADNWRKKVHYYLTHENKRRKIAACGRATVEKYHTHDIRARQMVAQLRKLL